MAMQQIQQQMLQLQNQLAQAMEEQKYNVSANNRVKLIISDKEFMTNSKTLSNQQHGNTLFRQSLSQANNDGGDDNKTDIVELYYDRNPNLFSYIIDYLRGYDLKSKLCTLKIFELEKLRDDAVYFKIKGFEELLTSILYARFDPNLGSPLIELSRNGTVAKRLNINGDVVQGTAVYGVLSGTASRYVEISIASNLSRNVNLGVTEANAFRVHSYPGGENYVGCSYYCLNGKLYRSGGSESWGASSRGDKIGALVKLNKESKMATIAFYKNGKLLKKEINLKSYMNPDKGVVFVITMYNANEYVQLVQNPVSPQ